MAGVIGNIVRQCSQGESVVIDIGGVAQQRLNKIPAADIVRQVAEILAAEGIVPHVLHHRAAIGIGVGFAQILRGRARKTLQQERLNLFCPQKVDDLLVRQYRVGGGETWAERKQQKNNRPSQDVAP